MADFILRIVQSGRTCMSYRTLRTLSVDDRLSTAWQEERADGQEQEEVREDEEDVRRPVHPHVEDKTAWAW